MAELPGFLLGHTVQIEPYEGEGPYGPAYGDTTAEQAFVDDKRRLVRDTQGAEVVSETTVYMRLDAECPVGSRVMLPSGRVTYAITSARRDGAGLPTPDHLEVACQ